jgi:hypothetical protein
MISISKFDVDKFQMISDKNGIADELIVILLKACDPHVSSWKSKGRLNGLSRIAIESVAAGDGSFLAKPKSIHPGGID